LARFWRKTEQGRGNYPFMKALELEPDLGEARFDLAGAFRESGRLKGAEQELRKVVEAHPKWTEAWYELRSTWPLKFRLVWWLIERH